MCTWQANRAGGKKEKERMMKNKDSHNTGDKVTLNKTHKSLVKKRKEKTTLLKNKSKKKEQMRGVTRRETLL